MHVREASPADAEAVARVARASWQAAYDDLLGREAVDATVDEWYAPERLRAELERATETTGTVFLVAEPDTDGVAGDDPPVVGFANAGSARTDDDPAEAFFSRLYVHPDRWGDGAGTALTGAVGRRLRDAGFETVWLEVFAANDVGRSFYESLGFERVDAVEETFGGTTLTTLHLRAPVSVLIDRDTR